MLNLDKNKKYLLACSYGPDSMYLFEILLKEGYNFTVAHVNYHFRKESDEEEKSLREYCRKHNVTLHVYDNQISIKSNLEEKAREIRYHFFQSIYKNDNYDALLVAHHKDDNLETYLMQKQRKNLPIFYGISPVSTIDEMLVIRPLLDIYKEDILKYNHQHNIPYSTDITNLENIYLRNRIRNELLNKYTREDKDNLFKEIQLDNDRLDLIKCKLNSNDIHLVSFLLTLSDVELAYAVNKIIREVLPTFECSMRFVNEIKKVLLSSKSNISIHLADEYYLCKEYTLLMVRVFSTFAPIYLDTASLIDNDLFYFDLMKCGKKKGITAYPITIRPFQSGDRYEIKGYDVSVNRLFIDWKMPLYLRKIWPIFEHDGKIVYIPRYQKDFKIENDQYFYVKYHFVLKK